MTIEAASFVFQTTLPLRLKSPNAIRIASRAGAIGNAVRIKVQRKTVELALRVPLRPLSALAWVRLVITVTRIGPRKMDRDNNIASLKASIDGIADAIGIDDGNERITWVYAQEVKVTRPVQYAVRIRVEVAA